jgi:phospholipid/cholesterol/gamma-HCH transport system substrate-binding protein
MGTEENKRSVIVGIFVLIGIIIFVVGLFTLAGQQKRFIRSVTLKALFNDVSGLRVGNNVWFSGVRVGTVREIRIVNQSEVEVSLNIEERVQEYIRKNSVAQISSESFIGNRNIVLRGGSPEAPPVEDGDIIEGEEPLNTDALMETLQRNNENVLVITNDFKELSGRLVRGEGTVGAILTDTAMADNLRSMVASLQRTSANTVRASAELSRFANSLNTKGGLANELLTDTVVFNRLQASVRQLQQATVAASQMTNNLQAASAKLNNTDNALGVMLNDPAFANRLKGTLQNLETSTEKFDENMEALQHVWPFRRGIRRAAQEPQEAAR